MSFCKQEGKDRIIFVTKEDDDEPIQTASVKDLVKTEEEEGEGLILPNGDINWNCPCLGGMASGPCGVEFREAFSCFHYSEADPKGSDCIDNFRTMQECMVQYPDLYPVGEDKEKQMIQEAEEAGQDMREDEVRISESKEEVVSPESDKGDVADEMSTPVSSAVNSAAVNSEDAVVEATSEAASETDKDTVLLQGESKS